MAGGLKDEQLERYHRDGFLHLPGVFSLDEVKAIQRECARLQGIPEMADPRNLRTVTRRTTAGGMVVDRLDPVADLSEVFHAVVHDPRLLAVAESVLGGPPCLFKDKLIFKNPGAFGYGAHQDFTVWRSLGVPALGLLSILLAVDAANAANGAVRFYPGLHSDHHCEAELEDIFGPTSGITPAEVLAQSEGVVPELQPGDAVVFSSLCPHDSDPNHTAESRRSYFITYNDAGFGDLRQAYYEAFREMMKSDRAAAGQADWFFR